MWIVTVLSLLEQNLDFIDNFLIFPLIFKRDDINILPLDEGVRVD
jgi:hypothetical protein